MARFKTSKAQRDQLNEPIIMARNQAFQAYSALMHNMVNKIGEMDVGRSPTTLSRTELKRLAGRD